MTGAAGFLGRHVARHCAERGDLVWGIGHGDWTEAEAASCGIIRWHRADIDPDSLRAHGGAPDIVIHCAGGSTVGGSFADAHADFRRNVATTAAVLDHIRTRAPRARLVYASSAAVYGIASRLPIGESDTPAPVSPYGTHKLAAEMLCAAHARHFGVAVAIVRLFSLYGPPLRKQLLWDACRKLSAGTAEFAGTGTEIRDWLHARDAARLMAIAADHASTACPVANGASGTGVEIRDVVAELAAVLSPGATFGFSGTRRAGDPAAYVAGMSIAAAWGFRPAIDWRSGVRSYADWYRRQQVGASGDRG